MKSDLYPQGKFSWPKEAMESKLLTLYCGSLHLHVWEVFFYKNIFCLLYFSDFGITVMFTLNRKLRCFPSYYISEGILVALLFFPPHMWNRISQWRWFTPRVFFMSWTLINNLTHIFYFIMYKFWRVGFSGNRNILLKLSKFLYFKVDRISDVTLPFIPVV